MSVYYILPSVFRYLATDCCDLMLCASAESLPDQGRMWEDSISPGTKSCAEFKPSYRMAHTCPLTAQIRLWSQTDLSKTPISNALNSRGRKKTRKKEKAKGRLIDPKSSSGKDFRGTDMVFSIPTNQRCGICQTKEENKSQGRNTQ